MPASIENPEQGLYSEPVYTLSQEDSGHPVILVCEHASPYIPQQLERLGLSREAAREHIAWDIGALDLAQQLSKALGATLISAGYSRLLIDLNRPSRRLTAFQSAVKSIRWPATRTSTRPHASIDGSACSTLSIKGSAP